MVYDSGRMAAISGDMSEGEKSGSGMRWWFRVWMFESPSSLVLEGIVRSDKVYAQNDEGLESILVDLYSFEIWTNRLKTNFMGLLRI
jgi:hypothetical protein